jgi:tRNA (cmo5U34)-methyltransferase
MGQFHFDPERYLADVRTEVPGYDRLQDEVGAATEGLSADIVLELGVGTGETARRVLARHPDAHLVAIDDSDEMLAAAAQTLRAHAPDLRRGRLQDPLPEGPFDLAIAALSVHHLGSSGKADLFARLAPKLRPGGRFVLADVVIPPDPADAIIPLDTGFDLPDTVEDQVDWLREAGFATARTTWAYRDLAVLVADVA